MRRHHLEALGVSPLFQSAVKSFTPFSRPHFRGAAAAFWGPLLFFLEGGLAGLEPLELPFFLASGGVVVKFLMWSVWPSIISCRTGLGETIVWYCVLRRARVDLRGRIKLPLDLDMALRTMEFISSYASNGIGAAQRKASAGM